MDNDLLQSVQSTRNTPIAIGEQLLLLETGHRLGDPGAADAQYAGDVLVREGKLV